MSLALTKFVDRIGYRISSAKTKESSGPYDLREFYDSEKHAAPKAVPVPDTSLGENEFDPAKETHPYRHAQYRDKLIDTANVNVSTVADLWRHAHQLHGDKACMGSRQLKTIHEEKHESPDGRVKTLYIPEFEPEVRWFTFHEIDNRIERMSRGIRDGLGLKQGDKMAIHADTSLAWQILAQSLIRSGIIIVTVFATLHPDGVRHALEQTEVSAVFTNSPDMYRKMKEHLPALKHVVWERKIASGSITEDWDEKGKKLQQDTGLYVCSIEEIERRGNNTPVEPAASKPEDDAMIMYTSGTMGQPKGVIMTHYNIVSALSGIEKAIDIQLEPNSDHCYLACLPLGHILEFVAELCVMHIGARIGYSSPRTLTDKQAKPYGDLQAYKPTILAVVPRVLETIKKAVMDKLSEMETSRWKRKLFNTAFDAKKEALLERHRDSPVLNKMVFKKISSVLGGRAKFMLSGAAPLSKETQEFTRIVFGCGVSQGYGLTETCAMCSMQAQTDPFQTQVVGTIVPAVEVKLVAVPEMHYRTDQQCPEGEIWIRGGPVVRGYYKMEEKTRESFTEDGWFKTGDIGRFDERGVLSIIDRKKYIVKLDTGEYISLETMESVYINSPFVSASGLCVHADSSKSFAVAMIIPERSVVMRWAKQSGRPAEMEWEQLLRDKELKKAVMDSLEEKANKAHLGRNERVKNITLVTDEWTPENGLLTAAMKLKRNEIAKKYQDVIDAMYQEGSIV